MEGATEQGAQEVDLGAALGSDGGISTQCFTVYVPNKDRDGKEIGNQRKWVLEAIRLLSEINGGATAMPPVEGGWLNDQGEIIWENPVLVYSFIRPDQFPYHTLTGGLYDSGNYPAVLDDALTRSDYQAFREQQRRAREQGRGGPRPGVRNAPLLGIGLAAVVEPSGSNMGYLGVAFTPEERARQLPKSGCTACATVAVDALGGITVRLDTTTEGQGHETVAQQIVADVLGV